MCSKKRADFSAQYFLVRPRAAKAVASRVIFILSKSLFKYNFSVVNVRLSKLSMHKTYSEHSFNERNTYLVARIVITYQ